MNLHFLDPSKLPDRIDSTLTIPRMLHPPMPRRHDEALAAAGKDDTSTCANVEGKQHVDDGASKKSLVEKKKTDKKKKSKLLFQKKIHLNPKQPTTSSTSDGNFVTSVNSGGNTSLLASGDLERDDDSLVSFEQRQQQQQYGEETQEIPMDIDQPATIGNATGENTRPKDVLAVATTIDTQDNEPPQETTETFPPKKKKKKKKTNTSSNANIAASEDLESTAWTSCYAVSFNNQGTYVASGHASGLVPVHSFLSRCLSAIYSPPKTLVDEADRERKDQMKDGGVNDNYSDFDLDVISCPRTNKQTRKQSNPPQYINGVTSLSWDKTGRYLLAGAVGDTSLRVMDNSHPCVGWNCAEAVRRVASLEMQNDGVNMRNYTDNDDGVTAGERMQKENLESIKAVFFSGIALKKELPLHLKPVSLGFGRLLKSRDCCLNQNRPCIHEQQHYSDTQNEQSSFSRPTVSCIRHSTLLFQLPQPLGGPCQFHPMDHHIGLACMIDSSLALFHIPPLAFYEMLPSGVTAFSTDEEKITSGDSKEEEPGLIHQLLKEEAANIAGNFMYLVPPRTKETSPSHLQYSVTHAAFGGNGDVVYAVTNCGTLLGFDITPSTLQFLQGQKSTLEGKIGDTVRPSLVIKIPGGASALQVVVSKNGKYVLINSNDCALRLYDVDELRTVGRCTATSSFNASIESQVKPKFVFQDPVSKAPWASCDFSADGEYVVSECDTVSLFRLFKS
ncbi:hypothetical protein HJC23_004760 [Cyclotella cryptica]|uniref:Uncharacterized protein n=1 Tax=Cyclotella cryptica TaxID=29204 RepID=A0ABD3PCY2_9STRA